MIFLLTVTKGPMYISRREQEVKLLSLTPVENLHLVHANIRQFIQKGSLLIKLSKEKMAENDIEDVECNIEPSKLKDIAVDYVMRFMRKSCRSELYPYIGKYFYADVPIYNNYNDIRGFIDGLKRLPSPSFLPPPYASKDECITEFSRAYHDFANAFTSLADTNSIAKKLLRDMILMTWFPETKTVVTVRGKTSPKSTKDDPWTLDVIAFFKFIEMLATVATDHGSGIVLLSVIGVGSDLFNADCYKDAVNYPSIFTLREYADRESSENMGNFYTCSVNFFNNNDVDGKYPENDDHLIGSNLGFLLNIEYCVLVFRYHETLCRVKDHRIEALTQYGWIFNGCRYVDIQEVQNDPTLLCLKKSDASIYNCIVSRLGSIAARVKFSLDYFTNSVMMTRMWDMSMQEEELYIQWCERQTTPIAKPIVFGYSIRNPKMSEYYADFCKRRNAILARVDEEKRKKREARDRALSECTWGRESDDEVAGCTDDIGQFTLPAIIEPIKMVHITLSRPTRRHVDTGTRYHVVGGGRRGPSYY